MPRGASPCNSISASIGSCTCHAETYGWTVSSRKLRALPVRLQICLECRKETGISRSPNRIASVYDTEAVLSAGQHWIPRHGIGWTLTRTGAPADGVDFMAAIRRRTCPNKTSQILFLQTAKLSLERNNLVEFRSGGSFDKLPTPN
jgi:hypothetical protein